MLNFVRAVWLASNVLSKAWLSLRNAVRANIVPIIVRMVFLVLLELSILV